jgi:hypothetical protein
MKLNIDPVMASRIKQAWAKLSSSQQARIAPLLAKANQQAVVASQTRIAPALDMNVPHQALLVHSALTNDQDGILFNLHPDLVVDVDALGQIWGTGKYQQLDPGWAESAAVWLEHLVLGRHAFPDTLPTAIPIADQVKIAIAGDWGTGDWRMPSNPAPSTDVRHHIEFLRPDITIHLGDVYYAGTAEEEEHLFVNLWPAGSQGSLTLCSNHEMYSGAEPYFSNALSKPLFGIQQERSVFVLENTNWLIVGLDSAYYSDPQNMYLDGSLWQGDPPWAQAVFLRREIGKEKKIILLTHHNGLSADGSTANNLWLQVMSVFPAGHYPQYWYWGHYHAGIVYKPYQSTGLSCRCSGHGAIPWGRASVLQNSRYVTWYESRSARDPEIPQRVLNGFTMLELDGAQIQEVFYDENGGIAWQSC